MPAARLRYNYDVDPLTLRNQLAAAANGWQWDPDWHDYLDEDGFHVHSRFHEPITYKLDPTALK
jgi:hypothetical protein